MKLKLRTFLLLVLSLLVTAGGLFTVWYLTRPSDEELIRASVAGIEAALSAPYKNDLQGQAENIAALKQYLGDELHIELPCYRYVGNFRRPQVLGDYFTIRKRLGNLNVLVSDVVVTFPEDREKTAYVRLTVNVSWRKVKQPPYTVKLTMSKEAGDWLVTGITFLENKKTPVP